MQQILEKWNINPEEYPGGIRRLTLGTEQVIFGFSNPTIYCGKINLKIGYSYISGKYYKHEIPTPAEIEYSINDIEDNLMSTKLLVSHDEILICTDQPLIDLLRKSERTQGIYTSRNIEDLFGLYANLSMGEPAQRYNLATTRDDFAITLLLREIMHHLKFKAVLITEYSDNY